MSSAALPIVVEEFTLNCCWLDFYLTECLMKFNSNFISALSRSSAAFRNYLSSSVWEVDSKLQAIYFYCDASIQELEWSPEFKFAPCPNSTKTASIKSVFYSVHTFSTLRTHDDDVEKRKVNSHMTSKLRDSCNGFSMSFRMTVDLTVNVIIRHKGKGSYRRYRLRIESWHCSRNVWH